MVLTAAVTNRGAPLRDRGEYEFVVQPGLAGHGPTLFAGLPRHIDLKLVSRLKAALSLPASGATVPSMAADRALRVVFAEDNYLVRAGTAALLAEVDEIDLVGLVEDPHSLTKAVDELSPDAVLTDIRMPPTYTTEGIVAAKRIRAAHPDVGVVVLSQHVEPDYAFELLADGVAGLGYLLKERISQVDDLVRALREVCRGGSALDPKVVEALLVRKQVEARSPLRGMTDRELDVLREMAAGRSNAAIARTLYLSERAVEKHISTLFQKLGLPGETETNRRVMAVLTFLEATGRPSRP